RRDGRPARLADLQARSRVAEVAGGRADAGARQGIRCRRSGQAAPCLRSGAVREPEDAGGTEHSRGVRAVALRALPDRSELTPCFASSIIRTAYCLRSTPTSTFSRRSRRTLTRLLSLRR